MQFSIRKDPVERTIIFRGEIREGDMQELHLDPFDLALLEDINQGPGFAADSLLALEMLYRRAEQRERRLPVELSLVQQQCGTSCGIACAAMVAGVTFAEARALAEPPLGNRELDTLLKKLGVRFERQLYPELDEYRIYIVTVPSLNVVGGLHFVVLRTGAIQPPGKVTIDIFDPVMDGKKAYGRDEQLTSWSEAVRILGRSRQPG
jgi:hypothetical protein